MKNTKKAQKEFVAFAGEAFTIEWYLDHDSKSIALDYLESLMRIKSQNVQSANPSIEFTPLLAKFGRIQGGLAEQINITVPFYLQRI